MSAFDCRYGEEAQTLMQSEGATVVGQCGAPDYQGDAKVLGRKPDGSYILLEWSWGSCSGCDEWEARDLTSDQIVETMRGTLARFPSAEHLNAYCQKVLAETGALPEWVGSEVPQ